LKAMKKSIPLVIAICLFLTMSFGFSAFAWAEPINTPRSVPIADDGYLIAEGFAFAAVAFCIAILIIASSVIKVGNNKRILNLAQQQASSSDEALIVLEQVVLKTGLPDRIISSIGIIIAVIIGAFAISIPIIDSFLPWETPAQFAVEAPEGYWLPAAIITRYYTTIGWGVILVATLIFIASCFIYSGKKKREKILTDYAKKSRLFVFPLETRAAMFKLQEQGKIILGEHGYIDPDRPFGEEWPSLP